MDGQPGISPNLIWRSQVVSKEDTNEVKTGYECGISIEDYNDIKKGDIIEGIEMSEKKRKL